MSTGPAVVEELLRVAYEDTQLLIKNDALGDQFAIPRNVDFLLRSDDEKKASVVCSFINDNQYGRATVDASGGSFVVLVAIDMPIRQNILCSISALMVCIAHLFKVEYDGWGCTLQKQGSAQ